MAADYAIDAVLRRGDDTFTGRDEIAAYFATVPERLGGARVVFDSLRVDTVEAVFDWHLEPSPLSVSGNDVCRIVDGSSCTRSCGCDRTISSADESSQLDNKESVSAWRISVPMTSKPSFS